MVTSSDAFTGENFRRGGFLPYAERYERAREFLQTVRELWDSWAADAVVADPARGSSSATARPGAFEHHGKHFDISGRFTVPRSPQGHPVIFQAGDSDGGREVCGGHRRLHLHPARHPRSGPGVLPRRQGPDGPLRA